MIKHHSELVLEITADDASTIQQDLNAAEEIALESAMELRHGILVTQHDFNSYTVEVSREVPFGETQEVREWGQAS
ncbi:hypothetical protein [Arthrobacter sp. M4]|uniref:hypothetical protein n=1 Tax=Arthrobacter sp. M4 TaxID=218160 RepID=UPI001CDD269E|nr:hypothetical protein [Arthrobacter sp. M4]MCA4133466.1 hypothetical protein [Arthrobacter sp. M4]